MVYIKNGKLTISGVSSNTEPHRWASIELIGEDCTVNISIDFKELGEALTGLGHVPCTYKVREYKTTTNKQP